MGVSWTPNTRPSSSVISPAAEETFFGRGDQVDQLRVLEHLRHRLSSQGFPIDVEGIPHGLVDQQDAVIRAEDDDPVLDAGQDGLQLVAFDRGSGEQAGIFDGDHRVIGHRGDGLDVVLAEGQPALAVIHPQHAEDVPVALQRHVEQSLDQVSGLDLLRRVLIQDDRLAGAQDVPGQAVLDRQAEGAHEIFLEVARGAHIQLAAAFVEQKQAALFGSGQPDRRVHHRRQHAFQVQG